MDFYIDRAFVALIEAEFKVNFQGSVVHCRRMVDGKRQGSVVIHLRQRNDRCGYAGFGYILAFLPAIFFAGTLLKGKTDLLRIFLISLIGVLIIHVLGILYMFFIATLRHAPMDLVTSWIMSQSGVQVFYDIFFAMIAIFAGRQMRKLLWIVMC